MLLHSGIFRIQYVPVGLWLIWALLEHENQRTEELQPDDILGTRNVGQRNETDAAAIQRSSSARAVQAQASR